MNKLSVMFVATVVGVVLTAAPAVAVPISWTLSGVTFDDGGTASGSFFYDADTDVFSAWSISIVAGSVTALPTFTYDPTTSKDTGCAGTQPCFDTVLAGSGVGSVVRQIGFVPVSALTNAGGTTAISLGFEQSCTITSFISITSYAESCDTAKQRATFSGTLSAATDPGPGTQVPEPATILLFGSALLGLAARRRRRS